MNRRQRQSSFRGQMQTVAWVFVASPLAAPLLGRDVLDLVAGVPIGLGILAWYRWRPGPPEHLASVEYVVPDGSYTGPDAITEPFYYAWCDCGWTGDDRSGDHAAREDAWRHTPTVRGGLHRDDR